MDYVEKHEGGLITATRIDTDNTKTNRMTITRKQKKKKKKNTDYLIPAKWPDLVIGNKKKENLLNSGLCYSSWP